MKKGAYKLLSPNDWPEPNDPVVYLKLDESIKSETLILIKEQKWKAKDIIFRTFMNFRMADQQFLERFIATPHQSGAPDFSDEGFRRNTSKTILCNLKL